MRFLPSLDINYSEETGLVGGTEAWQSMSLADLYSASICPIMLSNAEMKLMWIRVEDCNPPTPSGGSLPAIVTWFDRKPILTASSAHGIETVGQMSALGQTHKVLHRSRTSRHY